MREIKFRGKRIDRNNETRWVYGHYFTAPLTDENSGLPAETGWFFLSSGERMHCIEQDGVSFVIDVETLGEYTGLKDKTGKDIYDGDIVSFIDHKEPQTTERTGVVRYREWSASYVIRTHFFAYNDWINYSCEVIGNFHGNPELLEDETK